MPASSMNFATALLTITPTTPGFPPIVFKADTFFNEEEFLGEPQPDRDRSKLFMGNDGNRGQYIDIFATSGKRDITIFDGIEADLWERMAYNNPQPLFNLAFTYQRNDQDTGQIRTHYHTGCKVLNHPGRAMSNDVAVVRFNIQYSKLQILGPTGQPI